METKYCYGCMQEKEGTPFCEHCGYDERIPNGAHQLPKGTVLRGQYLIGKVLGQGGFGITYLGKDLTLDIPVAIKEYYPTGVVTRESSFSHTLSVATGAEDTRFEENRDRFLREARILARLQDVPEVVQIRSFFPENNTAYIVMGYVNGITLKEHLRRRGGKLSAQETLQLLKPLMHALSQVHQAGLVHRDISPDNIMITPEGQVRLIDFGAAHAATNAGDKSTQAVLKHGFAPPEQYQRKGQLGPWTDVYAICATVYNCLTGLIPPTATDRIMGAEDFEWDSLTGITPQQLAALREGLELPFNQRTQTMDALCSRFFAEEIPLPRPRPVEPAVSATGTIALGREESPTFTPVQAPVHTAPVQHSAYTAPVHDPVHTAPVHTSPAVPVQPGAPKKKSPLVPIIAAVLAVLVALAAVLFFLKPGTDGEEARVDRSERESSSGKKPAADAPKADAPAAEAPAADAAPQVTETTPKVAETAPNVEETYYGGMTHEEYMAAELDTMVTVDTYVQGCQSWWNNSITVYCQSKDGAYFLYDMACSEKDAARLVPGTRILVTGYKSDWAGETEIVDATFEFIGNDTYIAEPFDATSLLGTDELINHQNEVVIFKGLTVDAVEYNNGEPGDDIYVTISNGEDSFDFYVERYLTGPETEVYQAVGNLKPGDIVNIEGFLYWYEGPCPHITGVTVTG